MTTNELQQLIQVWIRERENTRNLEEKRTHLFNQLEKKLNNEKNGLNELWQEVSQLKKSIGGKPEKNQKNKSNVADNKSNTPKPLSSNSKPSTSSSSSVDEKVAELQAKYIALKNKYLQTAIKAAAQP